MAGGAYVPLDPSYPEARIKLISEDAELKVLMVQDEDTFAERKNIVKCPVLSVTSIFNDTLLQELSAVNWTPPCSQYLLLHHLHLRHIRKTQGRGSGTCKHLFFHSTWGIVFIQGPWCRWPVLALESHDL